MKNCRVCRKRIPKRWKYFCSSSCRNKYHNRKRLKYHKIWFRNHRQKVLLKEYKHLIQCLICNKWFRQVGSHIVQVHGCTAREYREDYGFDVRRGQLTTELREIKAKHVFRNKTVGNLKLGKKYRFTKNTAGLGRYKRSRQTLERLKTLCKLRPLKSSKSPASKKKIVDK